MRMHVVDAGGRADEAEGHNLGGCHHAEFVYCLSNETSEGIRQHR